MTKNEIIGRLREAGINASSTDRSAAAYVEDAVGIRATAGWFGFRISCDSAETERRVRTVLERYYNVEISGGVWRLQSKRRLSVMAFGGGVPPTPPTPPTPTADYLYFEAAEANSTVSMMSMLATAPDLEYSTDGETWQEWQHTTAEGTHTFDTITLGAIGDRVYLRGENPNGFTDLENYAISLFSLTGKIEAHGNAQSLVDGDAPTLLAKSMPLFSNAALTQTEDTTLLSAPDFPATSLQDWCYTVMFSMCTALRQPAVFGAIINKDSSAAVKQTGTAFANIYAGTEFDITDDNGVTLKGFEGIGPFPIVSSLGDLMPDPVNRLMFCQAIGNASGMSVTNVNFSHTGHSEYYNGDMIETNVFGQNTETFSRQITFESGGYSYSYSIWVPTNGYSELSITPDVPAGYHIVKWQTSEDGETWTDIPDSSGSTFTIRVDTVKDYYYKLILEQD